MVRALLLVVMVVACHGSPGTPAAGTTPPPLPPSSGTPIGILLDDATALHLRADQIDRLRAIDTELIAREDRLSSRERPSAHDPQAPGPQHRGGKRHARRHPGAAPDPDRAKQERQASEQDAIARALDLLDPGQRDTARKLLDERGFTTVAVAPVPSEPVAPPDDPDEPDDDAPAF